MQEQECTKIAGCYEVVTVIKTKNGTYCQEKWHVIWQFDKELVFLLLKMNILWNKIAVNDEDERLSMYKSNSLRMHYLFLSYISLYAGVHIVSLLICMKLNFSQPHYIARLIDVSKNLIIWPPVTLLLQFQFCLFLSVFVFSFAIICHCKFSFLFNFFSFFLPSSYWLLF